jgi:hypothetical protein
MFLNVYQNVISCLYLYHSNILHVLITSAFVDEVGTVHITDMSDLSFKLACIVAKGSANSNHIFEYQ